ncbi:hypothetical protein VT84_27810 [Gemmata sp. SH-PL17]|nr:hypothetical protein VT84_27810 [Gemmata sp. SH-PL17]
MQVALLPARSIFDNVVKQVSCICSVPLAADWFGPGGSVRPVRVVAECMTMQRQDTSLRSEK